MITSLLKESLLVRMSKHTHFITLEHQHKGYLSYKGAQIVLCDHTNCKEFNQVGSLIHQNCPKLLDLHLRRELFHKDLFSPFTVNCS